MNYLLQDNYNLDDERYVSLKEILDNQIIDDNLTVPLGKENDRYHYIDFKDIPCLFITGETGSGKSVFLDSLIISLMLKNKPKDIKFIMIDPKKIELKYYEKLEYTVTNIISDKDDNKIIIKKINKIYERRKDLLKGTTIEKYNKKEFNNPKLFHLFIIIDESCDFMSVSNNLDILKKITKDCDRLGIHFIIATNSANEKFFDKDFIENTKYRMTFDLTSKAEANWINIRNSNNLNTPGEAIIKSDIQQKRFKLQTPFISNETIQKIVDFLKKTNPS